ncbi:MAG: hypothetical protein WAN03_15795 [Candidatus Sulfotelmatobacter sp.]
MRNGLMIALAAAALVAAVFIDIFFNPMNALSLCAERTILEKTSPDGR